MFRYIYKSGNKLENKLNYKMINL